MDTATLKQIFIKELEGLYRCELERRRLSDDQRG